MKTSFFTAIILGVISLQQAQAVTLEAIEDYDYAEYDFAELDTETEGEGKGEVAAAADADCEETVGGVTIRLSTPECSVEPTKAEVPFDQQMLLALQELSGKSMTLYEALKAQFARSAQL